MTRGLEVGSGDISGDPEATYSNYCATLGALLSSDRDAGIPITSERLRDLHEQAAGAVGYDPESEAGDAQREYGLAVRELAEHSAKSRENESVPKRFGREIEADNILRNTLPGKKPIIYENPRKVLVDTAVIAAQKLVSAATKSKKTPQEGL